MKGKECPVLSARLKIKDMRVNKSEVEKAEPVA